MSAVLQKPGTFVARSNTIAPLSILFLALFLRLHFYVGVGSAESLGVVESAWEVLSAGKIALSLALKSGDFAAFLGETKALQATYGTSQMLLFAPLSLFYWIGGVNEVASVIYPLLGSLLNILGFYLIARLLLSEGAALIGMLLWALLPLDVFSATQPLATQPLLALTSLALLSLLYGYMHKQRLVLTAAAILAFLLLILDVGSGLTLAGITMGGLLVKRGETRKFYLVIAAVLGAAAIFGGYAWLTNFETLFAELRQQPGFGLLLPLVFISLAMSFLKAREGKAWLYVWLGINLLAFSLREGGEGLPGLFEANLLLVLMPLIMLAGDYFGTQLNGDSVKKSLVLLTPGLALVAWLAVRGQTRLIPSLSGTDWISIHTLFYFLTILSGVVFLGLVLSPLFTSGPTSRLKSWLSLALVAGLGLSLLPANWGMAEDLQARHQAVREAYGRLQDSSSAQVIYVLEDRLLFNHLHFLNGFGTRNPKLQFADVLGEAETGKIKEGILLYWDTNGGELLTQWWSEGIFGVLGKPRLVVAATLRVEEATIKLAAAGVAVENSPDYDSYMRLSRTALQAGELCGAYKAWIEAQAFQSQQVVQIPVDLEAAQECFQIDDFVDLSQQLQPEHFGGYVQPRLIEMPEGTGMMVSVRRKHMFFADPRVFDFPYLLQPNTVYLYSATIQAKEPVMRLYWGTAGQETYLDAGTFPEWNTAALLLATPAWDAPRAAILSPVLLDNYGFAYITDFYFQQVNK